MREKSHDPGSSIIVRACRELTLSFESFDKFRSKRLVENCLHPGGIRAYPRGEKLKSCKPLPLTPPGCHT